MTIMPDKKKIDWEAIEREYRAGQLSVSEIGRQNDVSHTAINKRAKKDGWTRDLTKRVRQEVSARLVSDEVSAANAKQAVELAAERGVQVVREHRNTAGRGRDMTIRLLAELDATTTYAGELEGMIADADAGDDNKRLAALEKVLSLPSRAGILKDLSLAARTWVQIERQAFNLDDDNGGGSVQVVISPADADL